MAAAIEPVGDEIAPVAMLVGQAGGDDPADDRGVLRRIEQGMVLGWAMNACLRKRAIQRPDDVAPFTHAPQPGFQFAVECPAPVPAFLGSSEEHTSELQSLMRIS